MTKLSLDSTMVGEPVTMKDLLSIIAPNLVLFGVTKRAYAPCWLDWEQGDPAVGSYAEHVLADQVTMAKESFKEWAVDMAAEGSTRFYSHKVLEATIDRVFDMVGRFAVVANESDWKVLADSIMDREYHWFDGLVGAGFDQAA